MSKLCEKYLVGEIKVSLLIMLFQFSVKISGNRVNCKVLKVLCTLFIVLVEIESVLYAILLIKCGYLWIL